MVPSGVLVIRTLLFSSTVYLARGLPPPLVGFWTARVLPSLVQTNTVSLGLKPQARRCLAGMQTVPRASGLRQPFGLPVPTASCGRLEGGARLALLVPSS